MNKVQYVYVNIIQNCNHIYILIILHHGLYRGNGDCVVKTGVNVLLWNRGFHQWCVCGHGTVPRE